jgi:hypothetical protein
MHEFCEYLNNRECSKDDVVNHILNQCVGQRRVDIDAQIDDKEQKLSKIRLETQEFDALITSLNLPQLHSELQQTKDSVSQGHQDLDQLKKEEV